MHFRKTIYVAATLLIAGFYSGQPGAAAPREKVPTRMQRALQITSPNNNARVQSPLVVKGSATQTGKIMVNIKATFTGGEQDLGTFDANLSRNNQWQTTPINLWAPDGAKNLRYVISAAQRASNGAHTSSVTVSPPQKLVLVPRDQLTQQQLKKLNPKIIQPTVILPPKNEVPKPGPIDPITGRPRNTGGSTSTDAATRITSPSRNNSTIEIPVLIEGTGEKNSNFRIEILTKSKKYGQSSLTRKTANADSDNAGKWSVGKIFSIGVDEADGRITHEITATRVEGTSKKGNTAKVTVFSNPKNISPVTIIFPTVDIVANSSNHVRGKAVPGSQVQVQVTVEGTNAKGHTNAGSVLMVKDWQTVTAGSNGAWRTPTFKFDAKDRVRNIKFHITAKSKDNPRDSYRVTVTGR